MALLASVTLKHGLLEACVCLQKCRILGLLTRLRNFSITNIVARSLLVMLSF